MKTPEDSELRTEIEEKEALDSTEEEQDLSGETEKVTIAEESQEALPQQKNYYERAPSSQQILRKSLYPRNRPPQNCSIKGRNLTILVLAIRSSQISNKQS